MDKPRSVGRDFSGGVNLLQKPYAIGPTQVSFAQNFFTDGSRLVKRNGSRQIHDTGLSGVGTFLSRFYPSGGSPITIVGEDDNSVQAMDPVTNEPSTLSGGSGFTEPVSDMANFLGSLYLTSGFDPLQYTDGTAIYDLAINGLDRRGKWLEIFQERMWISGDPDQPALIYYSNVLDPTRFPVENILTLDFDEGDAVTGLAKLGLDVSDSSAFGILCAITFRGIYTITNAGTVEFASFRPNKVGYVGSKSPYSIVSLPGGIAYFGSEGGRLGVFVFDGQTTARVSWDVDTEFEGMSDQSIGEVAAVFHDGYYKLYYSAEGSNYNNRELWLDIGASKKPNPSWWGPHQGRSISHGAVGLGSSDNGQLFALDHSLSFVYEMETGLRDGRAKNDTGGDLIEAIVHTREHDMAIESQMAQLAHESKKFLEARFSSDTPATCITVKTVLDGDIVESQNICFPATGDLWGTGVWGTAIWSSVDLLNEMADLRYVGERLLFHIIHNEAHDFILNDYGIKFKPHRRHTVIRES